METRDGFLSRWSRLKRGANPAPAQELDAEAPPAPVEEKPGPEGKDLEDLIAALPKVEDLVPGQSLAAFMQPWVPAALRNAALHRMWLLDPAISGYVDPALDYAYDYNALGGAPGFGPMEASQETIREVAQMFDRALGRPDIAKEDGPMAEPVTLQDSVETVPESEVAASPSQGADTASAPTRNVNVASHNKTSDPNDLRPAARRHGGALPG